MNPDRRGQTFSEHWHRVAHHRYRVASGIRFTRQHYLGETSFAIENPYMSGFFRLHPTAYRFVRQLDGSQTLEEVWKQTIASNPENAPTQDEVIRILSQLERGGLIETDKPGQAALIDQHGIEKGRKLLTSRLGGGVSLRIPIFNPDRFLVATAPIGNLIFSAVGFCGWAITLALGLKVLTENFSAFRAAGGDTLNPSNFFLLGIAFAFLKLCHEAGHGYASRRFGCNVTEFGLLFIYLVPMPYVDTTTTWSLTNRWHRAIIGAAGLYVELFLAALALVVWASTGDPATKAFCYNMVFAASVSALLFNGNPLMRYDAYYILSDLLEIPDLHQRSGRVVKRLWERVVYGIKSPNTLTQGVVGTVGMALYSVAAALYRVVIVFGLIVWVSSRYLLLGSILALAGLYSLFFKPIRQFLKYLRSGHSLGRVRGLAQRRTALLLCGLVVFAVWVPVPRWFAAEGVVQMVPFREVYAASSGYLRVAPINHGHHVSRDTVLLTLENKDLVFAAGISEARQAQMERVLQASYADPDIQIGVARQRHAVAVQATSKLHRELADLTVKAPIAGTWVTDGLEERVQGWISKGERLGTVLGHEEVSFVALVRDVDAANLFDFPFQEVSVRLVGQAEIKIPANEVRVLPASQNTLPSEALGWLGGGSIEVERTSTGQMVAAEPIFELRASLQLSPGDARPLHGRLGRVRISLPPEPLLKQVWRKFSQFWQTRYRE